MNFGSELLQPVSKVGAGEGGDAAGVAAPLDDGAHAARRRGHPGRAQQRPHRAVHRPPVQTLAPLRLAVIHNRLQNLLDVALLEADLADAEVRDELGDLSHGDHGGGPGGQGADVLRPAGLQFVLQEPVALLVQNLHELRLEVVFRIPGASSHALVRLQVEQHVHLKTRLSTHLPQSNIQYNMSCLTSYLFLGGIDTFDRLDQALRFKIL